MFKPRRHKKRGFSIVSSIRRTSATAYTENWPAITARIKKRDGNRCRYCRKVFPSNQLEVNHLIPVSMGGRTCDSNLATSCLWCHSKRPHHDHMRHRLK